MNLPNKLTMARIIAVPIFVVLFFIGLKNNAMPFYFAAFIVFVLASLTDMLDGKIARKYNLVTNFGKIMDPLADKLLVYAAFCIFVEVGIMPSWMFIIILAREFAVAGIRTVAASTGIVIAAGMTGKIKTVLQMAAILCILLAYIEPVPFEILGKVFLWGSLVMTIVSGTEYIVKNISVFKS